MQFIDLKAQQQRIRAGLERRILQVLDHGAYILGPEVEELERALADFCGARHCISCASGTDALVMPLLALGVGPSDAVFVPSFTFVATAEAVALLGAVPVFVDVDPVTFNIDPARLEETIEALERTAPELTPRGVIAVDLFGQPADYHRLQHITSERSLFLIADAAQSFGASLGGRRVGALAQITATSFFPAKPLGGYGDGGAVFCEDESMAEMLRSIRVHGQGVDKYDNVRIGINGRLDTIQAAILLEKLTIFEDELVRRSAVAERYREQLSGVVEHPQVLEDRTSAWAQYCVQSDDRDRMREVLAASGIPSAIYYPKPIHMQDAYRRIGRQPVALPVTEQLARRIFALPMHPYLSQEDQSRIVSALRR